MIQLLLSTLIAMLFDDARLHRLKMARLPPSSNNSANLLWCGVLLNFRRSPSRGISCYKRHVAQGRAPPWDTLFQILTDITGTFSFMRADCDFQQSVIDFIRENQISIPTQLVESFSVFVQSSSDDGVRDRGKDLLRKEHAKRMLSSPTESQSKHIRLEIPSATSDLVCHDHDTQDVEHESPSGCATISSQHGDETSVHQELTSSDSKPSPPAAIKPLSLPELSILDDENLISYLCNCSTRHDAGCAALQSDDLISVFTRISWQPTAVSNFVDHFVTPYLSGQRVCSRSMTSLLSLCLDSELMNTGNECHSEMTINRLVFHILQFCSKQLIDGTAKILVNNNNSSEKLDEILRGFSVFMFWSEHVTLFLSSVIPSGSTLYTSSIVEGIVRYLTSHSDPMSSKTCSLVMRLLSEYAGEQGDVVGACRSFADMNKSFLCKTLIQKLRDCAW